MRQWFLIMSCFAFSVSSLFAQSSTWVADKPNSRVEFMVNHLTISEIDGKFKDSFIAIEFDPEQLADTRIYMTVNVDSIDTGIAQRDAHLRSEDFFDVRRFPEMRFKTKSVEFITANKYKLHGELTVKGTTRPLTVDMTYGGMVKDYWGNRRVGIKLSGVFNRFNFGLDWNEALESGGLIVGEDVTITATLEFFQQTEINDLAEPFQKAEKVPF